MAGLPEVQSRTPEMCRMYRARVPVADIAAHFGVKRPAVYKALRRGGVLAPYRPADGKVGAAKSDGWEKVNRADLIERFAEGLANGLSIRRAAEAVGWTPTQGDGVFRRIRAALGRQAA